MCVCSCVLVCVYDHIQPARGAQVFLVCGLISFIIWGKFLAIVYSRIFFYFEFSLLLPLSVLNILLCSREVSRWTVGFCSFPAAVDNPFSLAAVLKGTFSSVLSCSQSFPLTPSGGLGKEFVSLHKTPCV